MQGRLDQIPIELFFLTNNDLEIKKQMSNMLRCEILILKVLSMMQSDSTATFFKKPTYSNFLTIYHDLDNLA